MEIANCSATTLAGYVTARRHGVTLLAHLILLGWFAQGADAQAIDGEPGALDDLPRYTVELIVFSYAGSDTAGNEVFTGNPARTSADGEDAPGEDAASSVFTDARENAQLTPGEDSQSATQDVREIPVPKRVELTLVEAAQLPLAEVLQKLERLDAYRPVLHAAWTQTARPREESPAMHLRALGNPPLGLDGTVTLYQGRFVHLVVDLSLDASTEAGNSHAGDARSATDRLIQHADEPNGSRSGMQRAGVAGSADFPAAPLRYRIFEDRIMRNGDVRYFDHPKFGVIARLSPATGTGEPDNFAPTFSGANGSDD